VYCALRNASDIEAHAVLSEDKVISYGTQAYFAEKKRA